MPARSDGGRALWRIAAGAWLGLLALVLAWEVWGAPATPVSRGLWVALKTLPLIAPLPWLWRGGARAHVIAALIALLYFSDGVAVAYDAGRRAAAAALVYGLLEIALALAFVVAAGLYARVMFSRARAGTES